MAVSGAWTYTESGGNATITDYNTGIGGFTPTIPETLDTYPVIAIADGAMESKSLTSVTIGHAVELQGDAIANNGALTVEINANPTTTSVSVLACPFRNCTIGANLTLGASVTAIPNYLCYDAGLTSLDINNVTTIGTLSFASNSLSTLTLDNVVDLGAECFKANGALAVTIDANVTTSVSAATAPFESCTLGANVTLTANATSIPDYLFYNCGVTSIDLSNVTNIGVSAFALNSIASLTLDHVINLDDECFKNNTALTSVVISANITTSTSQIAGAFEGCDLDDIVTISSGVTTIPDNLFAQAGLTEIVFPATVTTLGNYVLYDNDDLASITFNAKETVTFGTNILDQSIPASKGDIYGYDTSVETWANGYSTNYNYTMLTVGSIKTQVNVMSLKLGL